MLISDLRRALYLTNDVCNRHEKGKEKHLACIYYTISCGSGPWNLSLERDRQSEKNTKLQIRRLGSEFLALV